MAYVHVCFIVQAIQDYHLALFVGILVVVDVVVLITYTIVEGLQDNLGPTKTVNVENPSDIRGVNYCMR